MERQSVVETAPSANQQKAFLSAASECMTLTSFFTSSLGTSIAAGTIAFYLPIFPPSPALPSCLELLAASALPVLSLQPPPPRPSSNDIDLENQRENFAEPAREDKFRRPPSVRMTQRQGVHVFNVFEPDGTVDRIIFRLTSRGNRFKIAFAIACISIPKILSA
jgi:hypothetical protein